MRRSRIGTLLAAALAAIVLGGPLLDAGSAYAQSAAELTPLLDCVSYNAPANQLTAYFGYTSVSSSSVSVPAGGINFITPGPVNEGQVTNFQPGTHHRAFSVTWYLAGGPLWSSPTLYWGLGSYTVDASNDPATYCPGEVPTSDATPPSVVGSATVGSTLSADPGTWAGSPAPALSYQWQRDDGQGGWSAIAGATGVAYTPAAGDVGHTLRVNVTGTNPHAAPVAVASDPTAAVAPGTSAALTLLLSPTRVGAGGSATVSGVVYGPDGAVAPGAQVDLTASAGTVAASVYSGADGAYAAAFTAPGSPGPVLLTASVPSEGVSVASALAVAAAGGNATGAAVGVATTTGDVTAGGAGSLADLTATAASGTGVVGVVRYGGDPVGGAPPTGNDSYFDAGLSAGASFQSVTLQDCGLTGPSVAYWWTGATWKLVSPQTSGGGGCLFLGPFEPTGTSPTLGELTGTPFAVATAGGAAQVVVSAGSGQSATVGVAFATALAAKATDASGNPVSGVQVTFTAPAAGAGDNFPGGVNTVVETTDASGIATVPTFTADDTAGSYTVSASTSGATSADFRLTNLPGTATQLAFAASPGGAVAGQPFTTQPAVAVEDGYGNTVTGNTSAVTLGITPDTGAPSASLGGTAGVDEVDGVASFSGLSIDQAGAGYTLTATDGALAQAVSAPFDVTTAAPGRIVLATSAPTVAPGGVVTVTGAVYDALSNPIAGVTLDLSATAGSLPSQIATSFDGSFSSQYTAPSSAGQVTLQATAAGTPVGASASVTVTAGAAAALTMDLSASSVATGGQVTVSGVLQDSRGNPEAGVPVSLLASGGDFGDSGTATESVSTSVYGDYSASFTASSSPGPVLFTASVPSLGLSSRAVLAVGASSGSASGSASAFIAAPGTVATGGPGSPTPGVLLTASGGAGGLAMVQYQSDPESSPAPSGTALYFDAGLTAGNSFTSATIQVCGLGTDATAYWWDGSAWAPVSFQSRVSGGCMTLGPFASSGTAPTLAGLGGTPFAVATGSSGSGVTSLPLTLSGVQVEDANHNPLATGAALAVGQQYYLVMQVNNPGNVSLTPLALVEALQNGQVLSLQAVQAPVPAGSAATVAVLFTPTVTGSIDLKFLAWSNWLEDGGAPVAAAATEAVSVR